MGLGERKVTGNGGEGKGDIVKIYLFASPWQSFVHEGHEKHEEKILRKMVMSRLPLPNGAMVQK